MVVVRNTISSLRAGGPRQFGQIRNKVIIVSANDQKQDNASSEVSDVGLSPRKLQSAPVTVVEPRSSLADVLQQMSDRFESRTVLSNAVSELSEAAGSGGGVVTSTPALTTATNLMLEVIDSIEGVASSSFIQTFCDYGPENLRMSPFDMPDIPLDETENELQTIADLNSEFNINDAHQIERGNQSIVCIFDTAFARGLIDESRIRDTYHGDDVDSVYESSEGHGTMCVGAAAANKDEGVPFNGTAPDAEVMLVRITDSNGQIRSDYINQAWDWVIQKDTDKPIVANHSYGTPLCSGRPKQRFCDTAETRMINRANADANITSIYAAGNEAMRCGHRLSGITSGITGTNSISGIITSGALRFDGRDAQRYSSHGRGDCAPVSDPKPNTTFPLPMKTYYGKEDGWSIKDMSIGVGGSAGGTSHASPSTSGIVALLQSRSMKRRGEPMQTEEVKQIIERTAEPPRITQVNAFGALVGRKGWDARFGNGIVKPVEALNEV